jgi:hypothetical protein
VMQSAVTCSSKVGPALTLTPLSPTPPLPSPILTPPPAQSPISDFARKYYYLLKGMGVFGLKSRIGQASESVYRSIEEQATAEIWWSSLNLPRTWINEQALISLHVWILHNRCKVDYNLPGEFSGRRMQEALFERFWEDTTLRIRNAGIAEISVNKQLENVQKVTFDDLFGYDAALKVVDQDSDNMEMAAAVWKGVFREAEDADTEAVLKLADYVKREIINVALQPKEDVYRGWITWGPAVGESEAERMERQRRMLEGEWREGISVEGKVFFYHTTTQERRWDAPEDGLYNKRRFALRAYLAENPEALKRLGDGSEGGSGSKAQRQLPAGMATGAAAAAKTNAKAVFGKKQA